ncbi:hypothetical protein RCTIPTONUS_56 [Rhodobacter phage RcTiptonus]|nr:hypothetical protein RCTIPTONUS_56 [Rhodobacter phage RcTiptonus]
MPSAVYGAPARSGGGATTFLGLTDTPSSYTANKIPRVNSAGTALVWVDMPAEAENELPAFAGNGGKILALNAGGTAVEWITPPEGSTEELPAIAGQGGKILAVKTDASGVEWIVPPEGGGAEYPSFTGNAERVLAVNATEDGVKWTDLSEIDLVPPVTLQSIAANTTLSAPAFDGVTTYMSTAATDITFTIPAGLSVTHALTIIQGAAGSVIVSPASGVTLHSADNKAKTRTQWSLAMIIPIGLNAYVLGGDLG